MPSQTTKLTFTSWNDCLLSASWIESTASFRVCFANSFAHNNRCLALASLRSTFPVVTRCSSCQVLFCLFNHIWRTSPSVGCASHNSFISFNGAVFIVVCLWRKPLTLILDTCPRKSPIDTTFQRWKPESCCYLTLYDGLRFQFYAAGMLNFSTMSPFEWIQTRRWTLSHSSLPHFCKLSVQKE